MIAQMSGTVSMIAQAAEGHAAATPRAVAVRAKRRGVWVETTWEQLDRQSAQLAAGLQERGVEQGATVAVLSENRAEWVVVYLAIQRLGAVLMPVPHRARPDAVAAWLGARDVRVAICGDQEHVDVVIDGAVALEAIVVMDPTGLGGYTAPIVPFADVVAAGAGAAGAARQRVVSTAEIVGDEVVEIPAARMEQAVRRALDVLGLGPGDRVFSLAPLADAVTRSIDLGAAIVGGATIHFPETPATVAEDLREVLPTVVAGPRRAYELLQHDARVAQHQTGRLRQALIEWGYRGGGAGSASPRRWLALAPVARRHGLSRVRHAVVLGDERLGQDTRRFLETLGIPVRHVWGSPRAGGMVLVEDDPVADLGENALTEGEVDRSGRWRSQLAGDTETDAALEAELREHVCIRRAVIEPTADGRLVFFEVDFDAAALWAAKERIDYGATGSIAASPAPRQVVVDELARVGGWSAADAFVILPRELSVGEGTLTSAGEVARSRLVAEFGGILQPIEER